jgi:hypothetical protein
MYRRYTIHQDGDILAEDLDAAGKPVEPEPVPADERLPFEVVLLAPDGELARKRLLELLEAVLNIEQGSGEWNPKPPGGAKKLPVV